MDYPKRQCPEMDCVVCLRRLAVLLVVSVIFAIVGGWNALWDSAIAYNFAYIDASFKDRLKVLVDLRRDMLILSLPLAASWCIGLYYWIAGKTRSGTFEHILPLALILGPVEVIFIALSGFQYGHYYLAHTPSRHRVDSVSDQVLDRTTSSRSHLSVGCTAGRSTVLPSTIRACNTNVGQVHSR